MMGSNFLLHLLVRLRTTGLTTGGKQTKQRHPGLDPGSRPFLRLQPSSVFSCGGAAWTPASAGVTSFIARRLFMSQLLLALLLTVTPAMAEEDSPSLFFSPEEAHRLAASAPEKPEAPRRLRLDSLLYMGPGRWTVWLQGEKWTPQTKRADLRLVAVTADSVRLSYQPPGQNTPQEIVLRPGQTWAPAQNPTNEE